MSFRRELARARAMAWKDLRTERRSQANFNSVLFLALLMLLLFGFALGADAEGLRNATGGVLWLTVLFSGVQAFNRSYQVELDNSALETLLLYPGERWPIFVGKVVANLAFVLAVEVITVPLAAVLYHAPLDRAMPTLAIVLFLGTVGFVTLGTFYAALASRSRAREVLLPLLLFPMLVPVLIAAAKATGLLLSGDVMGDASSWLKLLVAFDFIFLAASIFVFDAVIGA
jgi:heme exporter protein B